jgi:hypothetical protein
MFAVSPWILAAIDNQTGRASRVSFPGEMSGNVALMSLWLVSGPHHTASAVINESNMT